MGHSNPYSRCATALTIASSTAMNGSSGSSCETPVWLSNVIHADQTGLSQELANAKQLLRNGTGKLAIERRVSRIRSVVSGFVSENANVRGRKNALRVCSEEEEPRVREHAVGRGPLDRAQFV